jgi:hypothetical protein
LNGKPLKHRRQKMGLMESYLASLFGSEFVESFLGSPDALREPTLSEDLPPIGPSKEQSAPLYPDGRGHRLPDNAEYPHDEDGIVGAFCRAYDDIETAIAEFLPDVYTPGDDVSNKPRYTYLLGSGANGVVVENNGLYIYSHYDTDPCGELLCNAWDMVRLHKFSDLDVDSKADTSPGLLPSFEKMTEFAKQLQPVRDQFLVEKYNEFALIDERYDEYLHPPADQKEQAAEDDLEDLVGTPTYRLDATDQEREQGHRIVDVSAAAKFLEDLI